MVFLLNSKFHLNFGVHTFFPIKKNTLDQFDPVYFLTLYYFKYSCLISLKNFEMYFKQRRIKKIFSQKVSLNLSTQSKLLCKKNY